MINAFYNPADAILDAKKLGDWASTIVVMAVSGLLFAVALPVAVQSFVWKWALALLATFIVGALFGGLLLKIALSVLGAKNPGYFESVTSIVYASAPFSLAALVGSLLFLIPKAGIILAAIAALFGVIAMKATCIRAVRELTKADLLTSLVAIWIVASAGAAIGAAVYAFSMVAALVALIIGL